MLLLYHMKPTDAVVLYNRYIGDWGGTSTTYRFEAVSDGGVTAELIKKPMTKTKTATMTKTCKKTISCCGRLIPSRL